mgnify:CR=1 FL=1
MIDDIWARDEIESPCIKICVIDRVTGYCIYNTRNHVEQAVIQAW